MTSREPEPLVPLKARAEWDSLAEALRQRGPAPCEQAPREMWWPDRFDDAEDAIRLCRLCPMRRPCLAYATAADVTAGIWGGQRFGGRR